MSGTLLRQNQAQLAVRVETTPGVDIIAGGPAASDGVTCQFECMRQSVGNIENPTQGPSYNVPAPIVGGLIGMITATFRLVGAGAAGTAPDFGRLLRACRFEEVLTAAATGPTAATTGTSTTVTLGATFGTTLNQYRGMPILLTGNPVAGASDLIVGYATDRTASLARGYSPVLSIGSSATIPANVLYRETSDPSIERSLTIYAYQNGLRHILVGCRGTWSLRKRAGQPAEMTVQLRGRIVEWDVAVATPSGFNPITRQPPIWASGMSQLQNAVARLSEASFDAGVNLTDPTNPEALYGFEAPVVQTATPQLTLNPYSETATSPGRAGAFAIGSALPFAAIWGASAGNRFGVMCPSFVITDNRPTFDNGFRRDAITGRANLPDAGLFLVSW